MSIPGYLDDALSCIDQEEMECDEYECPEHEFYNFEKNKSIKLGQIWALYSDIDTLPKYYAQVKRIKLKEQIVYIQWLEPIEKGAIGEDKRWIDSMLPLDCGTFVVAHGKNSYDKYAFSHKVTARQLTGKKKVFEIIPVVTEIWAVYRDWTLILSGDDINENCQYDLVWMSELTHTGIKVLILAKVAGHKAVLGWILRGNLWRYQEESSQNSRIEYQHTGSFMRQVVICVVAGSWTQPHYQSLSYIE